MGAVDLITEAEFRRYVPASGTGKATEIREAITRASSALEEWLDRRIRYRAPLTTEAKVIDAKAWAAGPIAVDNPVHADGRTLKVTFTAATAGVLTVTGGGVTEAFDAANGLEQHGIKFFAGVVTAAGSAGAAGDGTVTVETSEGMVELHSPCGPELRTLEYPIQVVRQVIEDLDRAFTAATDLVAGTDYEVRRRRLLARISGAAVDLRWLPGRRIVKVRYSAGLTIDRIPAGLKRICALLAGDDYIKSAGKVYGLQSITDALGTRTWSGPAWLTDGMKDVLTSFVRDEAFDASGERDFDLEAA